MIVYYTPQELAEWLSVHVVTIYRYIREGEFPGVKCIHRSYRIPEGDVLQFLERYTANRLGR